VGQEVSNIGGHTVFQYTLKRARIHRYVSTEELRAEDGVPADEEEDWTGSQIPPGPEAMDNVKEDVKVRKYTLKEVG